MRSSWKLLTAIFTIASIFEIVLFSNLTAFTPLFLQGIGYDEAAVKFWTGILASAGIALGFWFVPFWGVLADRYGRKLLILRSFAIESVSVMLMAFSQNIWVFLFGKMMTGLALGNTGLMFATLADEAPRRRVGFSISLVTGSAPVGVVVGSLLGGFVVQRWGVQPLFALDATLIAFVTIMIWIFFSEKFSPGPVYPLMRMLRIALKAVANTRVVLILFIFSLATTLGYFFSYPFIPNRIVELVGQSSSGSTIGLVFGIAGIATLIATPLWGIAADRFGHRRLLPIVTALTALLYIPLYFAVDVVQFTLRLFLLFGVSPAINSLAFSVIGLETPKEKRGAVMSMIYMPLNAAILIAPTLAVALTYDIREVFLYSALFTFGGFVFLISPLASP